MISNLQFRSFFCKILAAHLVVWGLLGLRTLGLNIPFLTATIIFLYLTFIPGIVILRILRIHQINIVEFILFSAGLSLSFIMFTGFLLSILLPVMGVSKPLSLFNITVAISVFILGMCLILSKTGNFSQPLTSVNLGELVSPPALLLFLLPLLSVLGAQMVNFYQSNIIYLILIPIIAIIVCFIALDKFITKSLYPLAIVTIALSLLFMRSLICQYITGADIHWDYHFYKLVEMKSYWEPGLQDRANGVLSNTMLAPIYSVLLAVEGTWIFKIIYPLFYCLVPLALYQSYQKLIGEKIGFLAAFFFVSEFIFFTEMLALPKQLIAELFLALFILTLITDIKISSISKKVLFIVFIFSMIVTHYGLSYLFLFLCITSFMALYLAKQKSKIFTPTFIITILSFGLTWYIYTASGSIFEVLVSFGESIYEGILNDLFDIYARQPVLYMGMQQPSLLHRVPLLLYYVTQFLIAIGIIDLLVKMIKHKKVPLKPEYAALSIMSILTLGAYLIIPKSGYLSMPRAYHIMLFFLSPFCLVGAEALWNWTLGRWNAITNKATTVRIWPQITTLLLITFFLFNSEFIYEVTRDHPSSVSLSTKSVNKYGDKGEIRRYYTHYTAKEEVVGALWLSKHRSTTYQVYGSIYSTYRVLFSYGMIYETQFETLKNVFYENIKFEPGSYIFLRYMNVVYGFEQGGVKLEGWIRMWWNIYDGPFLKGKNKIYANGGSEIYKCTVF